MTEYTIAGESIQIPTAVENERYLRSKTNDLITKAGEVFDGWYSSQRDCNSVLKNADDILYQTMLPIVQTGIQMLNSKGIYSINENIFMKKYMSGAAADFYDVLEAVQDKLDDISDRQEQDREYRQARKDSRGRVVGGGFGLGGALKGMATAGAINAATGLAHSLGNAVGNMASGVSASLSKSGLLKTTRAPLRKALIQCAYNTRNGIRVALQKEAGVHFKFVTTEESSEAEAIIENYRQDRIPQAAKSKQLIRALMLDPYETNTYLWIWSEFGDRNGDLRKMATYFDCPLEQQIRATAERVGKKIFSQNCKAYTEAFNKAKAAEQSELQIQKTLDTLQQYCKSHEIEESLISEIETCKKLLKQIDTAKRTVKNVIYDTREKAQAVRDDYQRFYSALTQKNILYQDAFDYLQAIHYQTDEFKNIFRSVFEEERRLRTPEHILTNINHLLSSSAEESVIKSISVCIPGIVGDFEQKEGTVRTITTMPTEEIPLFFINRTSNGKSGLLFTNNSLRIFSKGIFSNNNQVYPIETVYAIECTDTDEYSIRFTNGETINTNLKQNIEIAQQIRLGDLLNEIAQLIKNIAPSDRAQMYRIFHGVAVCVCGTHLLAEEKFCPSCNRMRKDNGEFVETQVCPNCRNIIPSGKKFCAICGLKLIQDCEPEPDKDQGDGIVPDHCDQKESSDEKPETGNPISEECRSQEIIKEKQEQNIEYVACSKCGNQVIKGKKFCSKCGNSMILHPENSQSTDMICCPNCGNQVKSGKKFCSKCGTKL